MARFIYTLVFCAVLMCGCASIEKKQESKVFKDSNDKNTVKKEEINFEADAVVVHAKKYTKLERKRAEAIRKHNENTIGVMAGTACAIVAYIATGTYFVAKQYTWAPAAILGITAAAAYIASAVSGFIYNIFSGH